MSKRTDGKGVSTGLALKRLLLFSLGGLVAWWIYSWIKQSPNGEDLIAVDLSGMQHIGPNFSIAPFYLNGTNGFNVDRDGGGGSDVCCVLLPRHWRPGLAVDLRWAVADWSQENVAEMAVDNYKRIKFERFRAKVPIEKYDTPGRVVVHFFAKGKARVVVGWPSPPELREEFLQITSHATDAATAGQRVSEMFSQEERNAMDRRQEARKQKYGGDWK